MILAAAVASHWLLDLLVTHQPEPAGGAVLPFERHLWLPLWQAPWLDCAYGGKVSPADLHAQMRRRNAPSYLPVADCRFPVDDPPFHVVLETPPMRSPLRKLFKKVVYEW